jgi:hypothetical protein
MPWEHWTRVDGETFTPKLKFWLAAEQGLIKSDITGNMEDGIVGHISKEGL